MGIQINNRNLYRKISIHITRLASKFKISKKWAWEILKHLKNKFELRLRLSETPPSACSIIYNVSSIKPLYSTSNVYENN